MNGPLVKSKVEILQNFVAFSEYMNFIIRIKYWNASGSGFPPSLIPTLWNIGILHHRQAKPPKHLQHSVYDLWIQLQNLGPQITTCWL